jgi:hypothetical protein
MEALIKRGLQGVGVLVLGIFLTLLSLLVWMMLSNDVFNHPLSGGAWPLVCSRPIGCVTSAAWHKNYQARLVFAQVTGNEKPDPITALTSLIRQKLVKNSFLLVPVSREDATRYREQVLGTHEEKVVKDTTGLSLKEYDELIILPLLRQEALRQQKGFDSLNKLFVSLSSDSSIYVFPKGLVWDKDRAEVVRK